MDNNDAKHVFLSQHHIPYNHLAIGNYKLENCNPTEWEMITNLWNPEFTLLIKELGELHYFSLEELLTFDLVQEMVVS